MSLSSARGVEYVKVNPAATDGQYPVIRGGQIAWEGSMAAGTTYVETTDATGATWTTTTQARIATTQAAVNAVSIEASAGGIDISAVSGSVGLSGSAGAVTATSDLASGSAIHLNASNAAGGINIDAGSAGVDVDSTGIIALTSASGTASALQLEATNGGIYLASAGTNQVTLRDDGGSGNQNVIELQSSGIVLQTRNNIQLARIGASGFLGFAGVPVTQATSPTTGVTQERDIGCIITQPNVDLAGATHVFTVSKSAISATYSSVSVSISNYSGTWFADGIPYVVAENIVDNTSYDIRVMNLHATNPLSGTLRLQVQVWQHS